MIEIVLIIIIIIFLAIVGLGFGTLKILEHYIGLCKIKEQEGDEASIKIRGVFKKSIAFFVLLNFLFLVLFLIL